MVNWTEEWRPKIAEEGDTVRITRGFAEGRVGTVVLTFESDKHISVKFPDSESYFSFHKNQYLVIEDQNDHF